jgi:hypothetical protein
MPGPKHIDEDSVAAGDSRRERAVRGTLTGLGLLAGLWMIAIVSGVLGFRPFPDIPFVSEGAPPGSIWLEARDREDHAESEPASPSAPAESDSGSHGLAAPVQVLAAAIPLAPAALPPRPRPGARDGHSPRAPGGRRRGRNPGPAPGGASKPGPSQSPGNSGGHGNGNAFGHAGGSNGNAFGHTKAVGSSGNGNAFGHAKAVGSNGNGNAFGHVKGKGHKH